MDDDRLPQKGARSALSLAGSAPTVDQHLWLELHQYLRKRRAEEVRTRLRTIAEKYFSPHGLGLETAPPLHVAAYINFAEGVEFLLGKREDVRTRSRDGHTALHCAAMQGSRRCARYIIKAGADVNARDNEGTTPIHAAVAGGYPEFVKDLIRAGADPEVRDDYGVDPLHTAAYKNALECCTFLLDQNVPIDSADKRAFRPIHWAIVGEAWDVAKLLVQRGCRVDVVDDSDRSPLHWAAEKAPLDVFRRIVDRGADPNGIDDQGCSVLITTIQNGHTESALHLLALASVSINGRDKEGNTALHWASSLGNVEVISKLLAAGASVDVADNHGAKPIHTAAYSSLAALRMIVAKGGLLEDRDKAGRTALHWAASSACAETVEYLVSIGANINALDHTWLTPLDWLLASGKSSDDPLLLQLRRSGAVRGVVLVNRHARAIQLAFRRWRLRAFQQQQLQRRGAGALRASPVRSGFGSRTAASSASALSAASLAPSASVANDPSCITTSSASSSIASDDAIMALANSFAGEAVALARPPSALGTTRGSAPSFPVGQALGQSRSIFQYLSDHVHRV